MVVYIKVGSWAEIMCGIAGIISSSHLPADRKSTLLKMMESIRHRGPDGSGVVEYPGVLFGHRRLAIIDLDNGTQPMCSQDGRYTLNYNGEIYNYLELRQALSRKGVRFATFSDTEVLLQLLIHDGTDSIRKLNGMYAFVLHDNQTGEWVAARDPFGIKPFYYSICGGEFVYASEIKAIICHPNITPRRNKRALHHYMTFQFCLGKYTLFEDIYKLEPGNFIKGRGENILLEETYWDTNYSIDLFHTEEYFVDRLRATLEDSIRLQLRSDVPVGGYLSGGIDSSLVCTLAAAHLGTGLPVFHGKFHEGPQYDESDYAHAVADTLGGTYNETVPSAQDFVDSVPDIIYALDEPVAGPGVFPQYSVSRDARRQVTVVLGGQGGDEIFGGYARYMVGYLEQALKGAIFDTSEEGMHLVTLASIIPQLPLLQQYKPLLSQFWGYGLFDPMEERYFHLINRLPNLSHVLTPDALASVDGRQVFEDFLKIFNHSDTTSYINKMTHFDQKTLLPALLQIEDRVSMAVSLESRVPLLDTRIVDLVTTMPPPLKFQGGRTKHILKQAIRTLIPEVILERQDKMGFPVPLTEWVANGPVREFVSDVLLSSASVDRGLYRREALEAMLTRQGVGSRELWGALSLELWHRQFIDA